MSVLEPEVQPVRLEQSVVSERREPAGGPADVAPAVVDHVRSHSMKCYWDFVECRWRCSGP